MTEQLEGQMSIFDLDLPYGKTFPEPSPATMEQTSKPSSKRSVKSGGGCGVSVPMPPKGKWLSAGCVVGDGYSVAWRVYDAQFWGVPQRRKRIYLIADFGSERAGEILFERESVSGDPPKGGETGKRAADNAERGIGRSDNAYGCDLYNGQLTGDKTATLNANSGASASHAGPSVLQPLRTAPNGGDTVPDVVYAALALYENHSQDSRYTGPCEVAQTVSATYGMGGNNQPFVVKRIEHE